MAAQLALAMIGCFTLAQLEAGKRRIVLAVVMGLLVLSLSSVGADLYFRFTDVKPRIPATTRWIAANAPPDALVFYELSEDQSEVNYGYRMSYTAWHRKIPDEQYTPVSPEACRGLPEVDLYDEDSVCSIEALVPGAQPFFVKYALADPQLNEASFALMYRSEDASVFSLACPAHGPPDFSEPPVWRTGPYVQDRELPAEIPGGHIVAATTRGLADWLQSEGVTQRMQEVVFDEDSGSVDRLAQLERQLGAPAELPFPAWLLPDYTSDNVWNEEILSHAFANYYVAQFAASGAQWLECKQRVAPVVPTSDDELAAAGSDIKFGESPDVKEWRVGSRSCRPGEIVPMELTWTRLDEGNLTFYVHMLDLDWNLFAQIDLAAAAAENGGAQVTRMGLYLPPDLPAGEYQIRLGVYRAEDGRRLTLPSGEDSVEIRYSAAP